MAGGAEGEQGGQGSRALRGFGLALLALGLDVRRLLALRYLPRYLADRRAFRRAGGVIARHQPVLEDLRAQAGTARGHYFHQDLLVATLVQQANPIRHLDVGSRIDGFVAHVASFREVEVIDIRPLGDTGHPRIRFMQADLMNVPSHLVGICDSLSCLHALEHLGLGRYGDPIDPEGHRKGFRNLHRLLAPSGILYLSFPIGESGVHFNAHRVFAPAEPLEWARGLFELLRFDFVDDAGALHREQSPTHLPALHYGCGIYTLRRTA